MRKIVEGIVYNTERAIEIATHYTGLRGSNPAIFNHATLYRGSNGKWFLVYRLVTRVGVIRQQARTQDVTLTPLSESRALDQLTEWNEVELIQQYFPKHLRDA
jgi:hypothetical protein